VLVVFIADQFVEKLTKQLEQAPVNRTPFYYKFRDRKLSEEQLRRFAGQYFWFCKNFIKVLVGLIYNIPDTENEVRLELIKTLFSEMGYGNQEEIHLNMLRNFTSALNISEQELDEVKPITDIEQYIQELGDIFLNADYRESIGAEFGVEITAALEFTFLYPGLKKYSQFSADDIIFFKFHLAEEELHGDWLTKAVVKIAKTNEDRELIEKGAMQAAELWNQFWIGMDKYVFQVEE
jgi:pyrroloquinoline quinone (PQQ) biosynthesis protein C